MDSAGQPGSIERPARRARIGPTSIVGLVFLLALGALCFGSLFWTLGSGAIPWAVQSSGDPDAHRSTTPRYNAGDPKQARLPPFWVRPGQRTIRRLNGLVPEPQIRAITERFEQKEGEVLRSTSGPVAEAVRRHWPRYPLGTDVLGRDVLIRSLTGGAISLGIGLAAALISVCLGTLYGAIAGSVGGRIDAIMMRIVDVLYGLPYILLVVLLAVAADGLVDRLETARVSRAMAQRDAYAARLAQTWARENGSSPPPEVQQRLDAEAIGRFGSGELSASNRMAIDVIVLLVAIGGVSWLTMARVIRGQVLSLKARPFMEAARAVGVPARRQFVGHLLPNLVGPIVVYATLTVPQAILQESFLSFLGIGVKPPLPSWGNMAAQGLDELNPYESNWWLLLVPCVLLGSTLLALNFVGEALREAMDPKRTGPDR